LLTQYKIIKPKRSALMPIEYKNIPADAIKIPLPDTSQSEDYSCGAVAIQAICGYFGHGLEDEWTLIKELKIDKRVGTNPEQLVSFAKKLGYETRTLQPLDLPGLRKLLDERKPVMMMLQAWRDGGSSTENYEEDWKDGHWVVAIGYDENAIFFEDPALAAIRGYILNEELEKRWHDVGSHNRHIAHYGLAIWKPDIKNPAYYNRARHIA